MAGSSPIRSTPPGRLGSQNFLAGQFFRQIVIARKTTVFNPGKFM
jgi:hypothetical protein